MGQQTSLLLARHGQSEWNAVGRWQGQADPALTELGRRQAASAASQVGAVDAIVSSDLERASHTAALIAELLGVGPVIIEPLLRERDAGEWSGLTKAEIERDWPGYIAERKRPPGFEPEEAFGDRVMAGLDSVAERLGPGSALVVTHTGVVYTLERLLGAPFERLANLGARAMHRAADGSWALGERIDLNEPAERTLTPEGQL